MKRIIAAIQASALVLGATAFAEQVSLYKPTVSDGIITVTGSIPAEYAGQNVSVQIIKPEGDIGDYTDIFYLREVASDETGSFTHSFTMPEIDASGMDTTGTYTVYAGSKGLTPSTLDDEGTQTFFYCTESGRNGYIDNVENAADETELLGYINSSEGRLILNQMGVLTAEYDDLSDTAKGSVNAKLLVGSFDKEENFVKTFNDAIALEVLNTNLSDNSVAMEEMRAFGEYLGIDYDIYDNLEDADAEFLNQRINTAKGTLWKAADDFKKAVTDSFALISINAVTDYRNVWTATEKYLDNFAFTQADLQYYLALTDERDIYTINKALTNKGFTTIDAVKTAFEKAVAEVKKSNESGSGSTGGGSSSGGSGIALVAGTSSLTQNQQNAENVFFNDVPETHWAYECIRQLKESGVLNGDEKGNFNPEQTLTREIFVTMLSLGMNLPAAEKAVEFKDVPAEAWYADFIARAARANIVRGIDSESFGVGMEISRQDMAVMIYRAAKYKGIELMPEDAGSTFADDGAISFYAKEAVYSLKNSGMISGISETDFAPNEKSTKAQAARLIYNLINAM
ncbi:MAG: S-layer homology domain-containing protein [Clostridia bacterium]|nr:S-layer homology domain-containing protein [Clostridia bacterium]MBP3360252.1 S-layer homology domain-containing protein [Clostridia bacterium]